MPTGEKNALNKYYRDRAKLMDFFGVTRSRWYIHRSGNCVYAESEMGNTIWAESITELQNTLFKAGVAPQDIKLKLEEK